MQIETKYLIREKDRHGNVRLYYRKKPGGRIRIRETEGTPEFVRAVALAMQGKDAKGKVLSQVKEKPVEGTIRDLIVAFYSSAEFRQSNDSDSQRNIKYALDKFCLSASPSGKLVYGQLPVAGLEPRHIRVIRDQRIDTPWAANQLLSLLRRAFAYGLEAGLPYVKSNPARDVTALKTNSKGHHSWTEEEVLQFEAKFTIGTMKRLAPGILLYTGQRRSDVVRFGPATVKNDWLVFTQHKNRNRKPVEMALPFVEPLKKLIEQTPGAGKETWLVSARNQPFEGDYFSRWFKDACKVAGVPGTPHGLRKAAASRLAELGCTEREIMAITGHTTSKEVDRYAKSARQKVLAKSAMDKMLKPHLQLVSNG